MLCILSPPNHMPSSHNPPDKTKIPWHHFSSLHPTIHNHESSTCFHEHSTTYIGMRNKDIYVMQSHMLFTHSNNNNNHDIIHNNKKFKPTQKAKSTTTYSRV
ncbi:hypothetical protein GQ457_08G016330 [Hibiscus cannabinus]